MTPELARIALAFLAVTSALREIATQVPRANRAAEYEDACA